MVESGRAEGPTTNQTLFQADLDHTRIIHDWGVLK